MPLDVIKTRIQAEPGKYKGVIDCLRTCYQKEGLTVLFRGMAPTLLRAFPCNAATFFAYTWTMRLLVNEKNEYHVAATYDDKNTAALWIYYLFAFFSFILCTCSFISLCNNYAQDCPNEYISNLQRQWNTINDTSILLLFLLSSLDVCWLTTTHAPGSKIA